MSQKAKQNLVTAFAVLLIFFGIYYVGVQIVQSIKGSQLLSMFTGVLGKELITDSRNHTNILMMGIGGQNHDGGDLTDTIMVASLDQTTHRVSLLSIPRDFYMQTTLGGSRINEINYFAKKKWGQSQGLDFVRENVEKMLGITIPYAVKVDFDAFKEIVDSMGGVDVYVSQAVYDPLYPKGETYEYETFSISVGMQHLDGATALKYARSRETSSDFARSKRQQELLVALKNKAASQNLFEKEQFIKEMYYSVRDHVETNLTIREMLSLANFGAQWDSKNFTAATINDESSGKGGFLYQPLKSLYGGAFVLLPAGADGENQIRQFAEFILYGPTNLQTTKIAVLNGTKEAGLAGKAAVILTRMGFNVVKTKNASSQALQKSTWYVRSADVKTVVSLAAQLFPGDVVETMPQAYMEDPDLADAQIVFDVGTDSKELVSKLNIFRGIVSLTPTKPATPNATTATSSTSSTKPSPTSKPVTPKPTH